MRWLFAVLLLLAATPAAAHTRSESFSSWRYADREASGVFQVDARRATQLVRGPDEAADLPAVLATRLAQGVMLSQGGQLCAAQPPRALTAATGQLRAEIAFACPRPLETDVAELSVRVFEDVSQAHVHYARVERPEGPHEAVLTAGSRLQVGGPEAANPQRLMEFVRLGFEHVLSGLDHLAFLLALTLLAGRPLAAVVAATGFTLGHSLTLGLVAAGVLQPDTAAIEALIGFTVAFAGGEALAARIGPDRRLALIGAAAIAALPLAAWLLGREAPAWPVFAGAGLFAACAAGAGLSGSRRMAPVLAAAFGLIHGAGFAGPLVGMELPRGRLVTAILGFNLGVEAAQLAALAAFAVVALALTRTAPVVRERAFVAATAALGLVGTFWFVSRSLG